MSWNLKFKVRLTKLKFSIKKCKYIQINLWLSTKNKLKQWTKTIRPAKLPKQYMENRINWNDKIPNKHVLSISLESKLRSSVNQRQFEGFIIAGVCIWTSEFCLVGNVIRGLKHCGENVPCDASSFFAGKNQFSSVSS